MASKFLVGAYPGQSCADRGVEAELLSGAVADVGLSPHRVCADVKMINQPLKQPPPDIDCRRLVAAMILRAVRDLREAEHRCEAARWLANDGEQLAALAGLDVEIDMAAAWAWARRDRRILPIAPLDTMR